MGINVKVKESGKHKDIPVVQVKLEKDLKSCMRCRFFYGNNNQCIISKCIKEPQKEKQEGMDEQHICFRCPYKRNDSSYCFPCMKKILGLRKDDKKDEEMEERKNGSY